MTLRRSLLVSILFAAPLARAETPPPPKPVVTVLRAARMLDVKRGKMLHDAAVVIDGDTIRTAGEGVKPPDGATVIDLGDVTLLPGLIDCHTHLMARIADEPNGYAVSLLTKSQAFRALEGAANARATLQGGFTSVRDVENEGSGYADARLTLRAARSGRVRGQRQTGARYSLSVIGSRSVFGGGFFSVAPFLGS